MTLLSETETLREIVTIDEEPCGAMRKARRYLAVSRRLRSAQAELRKWAEAPDFDEAAPAAKGVREQLHWLRKLDGEVRVRASKALRSLRKIRLGFGYGPHAPPKLFGRRSL
ncbi:MAG: hypothetical protein M9921_02155 [Fimbriimonadaceae bacterium]|nr:hypothetical protein [Chthonomonadaceae bacterium]MCO5295640.1 hypothetical protein [Fimbriimonadaceae bacterium]